MPGAKFHISCKNRLCHDPGKVERETTAVNFFNVNTGFAAVRHDQKLLVVAGASAVLVPPNFIVPEDHIVTGNFYFPIRIVIAPVEVIPQSADHAEGVSFFIGDNLKRSKPGFPLTAGYVVIKKIIVHGVDHRTGGIVFFGDKQVKTFWVIAEHRVPSFPKPAGNKVLTPPGLAHGFRENRFNPFGVGSFKFFKGQFLIFHAGQEDTNGKHHNREKLFHGS